MDFGRIIGALVQGAAAPPRRRRSGAFGMTVTETRQVGRVLGTLATAAIEAMQKPAEAAPAPRPTSRPRDIAPTPEPRRPNRDIPANPRIPQTGTTPGASPWAPRPAAEPPAPRDEPGAEHAEALLLTQAMIAAARADGTTDAAERTAISRQLDTAGLTPAERDHVLTSLDTPMTPQALAQAAQDPMLRAQLYAAAVATMGDINPTERTWLNQLGTALKLDTAARASIEARLAG